MLVKELIGQLANFPVEAEVTISYVYPVDTGETASCSEDVAEVAFDRYSGIVDLVTKGYMEEQ